MTPPIFGRHLTHDGFPVCCNIFGQAKADVVSLKFQFLHIIVSIAVELSLDRNFFGLDDFFFVHLKSSFLAPLGGTRPFSLPFRLGFFGVQLTGSNLGSAFELLLSSKFFFELCNALLMLFELLLEFLDCLLFFLVLLLLPSQQVL